MPQYKNEDKLEKVPIPSIHDSIKITFTTNISPQSRKYDPSIIDITDEIYHIDNSESQSGLVKYEKGVPFWSHSYVYSASELNHATTEQQRFYSIYKANFLNGVCLDIEGNSNYSFILLFDLLNDYEEHNDIKKLEDQIKILGEAYPKTKSYGVPFLIKLIKEKHTDRDPLFNEAAKLIIESQQGSTALLQRKLTIGYNRASRIMDQLEEAGVVGCVQESTSRGVLVNDISSIKSKNNNKIFHLVEQFPDYTDWKLGDKYCSKIDLTDDEILFLNKLYVSKSAFSQMTFCNFEIFKLFIKTLRKLSIIYKSEGDNIEHKLYEISSNIALNKLGYTQSNNQYDPTPSILYNIYNCIWRQCENKIREKYDYKAKLDVFSSYYTASGHEIIKENVISKVDIIIDALYNEISNPDEATEKALNSQKTTRWKLKLNKLTQQYVDGEVTKFIQDILNLGRLNDQNPSVENIYYEASKFIAKHDKIAALSLYIHYINAGMQSATFNNKQLTKITQKSLFKDSGQIQEFEIIITQFIQDKNIDKALEKVAKFYAPKRKKISIDKQLIKEVQEQHSETVELLNEYLQDESDEMDIPINSHETTINVISLESENSNNELVSNRLNLSDIQLLTLRLFVESNFTLPRSDLKEHAKVNGYFVDQLVESINDVCFDTLDDVLIEEDDNYYVVNEGYYNKIITQ